MPEKLKKLSRRGFFGRLTRKKTYLFTVQIEEDECRNWNAWIAALPDCAATGYTEEEALEALRERAQEYIEALVEKGQPVPVDKAVQTVNARVLTITL